jgi:aminoglycoside phosphotransferase
MSTWLEKRAERIRENDPKALKARIAELEADKARLDWLAENTCVVPSVSSPDKSTLNKRILRENIDLHMAEAAAEGEG